MSGEVIVLQWEEKLGYRTRKPNATYAKQQGERGAIERKYMQSV